MATFRDLATRVLQKIAVIGVGEPGSASDIEKVEDALRAVHADLRVNNLLRWTTHDIPEYAEEPYVMMAAFLCAADFGQPPNAVLWAAGLGMIQAAVSLRAAGTVHAEYF